jgi:signal transduction histidine kinase
MLPSFVNGLFTMRVVLAAGFIFIAALAPAYAQESASPFEARIAEARSAMMADPATALNLANEAEALAGQNRVEWLTAQWLQGEALNRLNRPQEAAPILDAALEGAGEVAPNTKLHGDLMMARAGAARAQGEYAIALTNFQGAHDIFAQLGEPRSQSMTLLQIGSIYTDAHDYRRALEYYQRAGEVYAGDPSVDLSRFNNIANARRELGDLAEAEAGFRQALAIAEQMGSSMLRARILSNIAEVQIAQGRVREADATARAGLQLRAEGWTQFLWGVRARAAFARGDRARAAELIARTFAGEDLSATTMPFRDFHRSAHQIYAALGDERLALRHLEAFKRLDDEARDVAASANMALMGAQFDFANQELQISQLRTETLESQARQRTLIFFGAIAIAVIILGALGYGYWSMRKSRNQVRAVNAQLNTSNVALEKALKAKSEFLATTSHEIRTPLNGILGMTQIMLQDARIAPDVRERVEIVHGAGETMRAIVDDILDVAKMETGKLTVAAEPFNPRPTLEDACRLWRINAEAKGVVFEADLADCPARIVADEQRLRQIVFNLMSNSVKFTDAGRVALKVRQDAEAFVIEVADTGIGIPAEQIEDVFTPFHQVNGGTTRKHGGTGLGLSICRNLSRAMGGDVSAASTVGEGSTFTLRLPLPATSADEGDAAVPANDVDESRVVLAVEPNPFHLCLLEAFCLDQGRTVRGVATIGDAVAALQAMPAHVIVVSAATLPSGLGEAMGALMELRQAAPTARVVLHLGEDAPIESAAARLCGIDEVLEGPFDAAAALAMAASTAQAA